MASSCAAVGSTAFWSSGSDFSMIRCTSSKVKSTRELAVAGLARTPVAAERLLFEELLAAGLETRLVLAEPV